VILVALPLFWGCHAKPKGPPMSEIELMNRAKLDPYPPPVKAAFLRQYSYATVTDVDVYNDVSGRVLYEVNYLLGGEGGAVVYDSQGSLISLRSQRVTPAPARVPDPAGNAKTR
jgi:hypothetical protein